MDWYTQLDKQIADYLPDLRVECDEPMSRHTSFRIGGPARRMAFPERGEQLVLLMGFAEDCGARPLVIGNGTNLLAPDRGLDRLVVNTSAMSRVELGPEAYTIQAEAGVSLARLADFACKQGLTGLEFAHGIPGTLGGAVCMNAGAYDGEMKQVVRSVTLLFPEEGVHLDLTDCDMDYLERECPNIARMYREFPGQPLLVRPVAHFFMGGIPLQKDCTTDLAGLYACGEVTGGLHGANRLAGSALTETVLFGRIAGLGAADYAAAHPAVPVSAGVSSGASTSSV